MIIPDLNILVYAYDSLSPKHARARDWWKRSLSGTEAVGIPWPVVFGFIRLWTSPKVFANPMTIEVATAHVEAWFQRPVVRALNPGPRHLGLAIGMLRAEGVGDNLTMDAHLAALAMEAGAILYTADADFLRFDKLKWRNPLT